MIIVINKKCPRFSRIYGTASLKSVAVKTTFLLQLASARLGSFLQDKTTVICGGRMEEFASLLLNKNQSALFTPCVFTQFERTFNGRPGPLALEGGEVVPRTD